jgi:hypothetical protein
LDFKTWLEFWWEQEEPHGIIAKLASRQSKVMKELVAIRCLDLKLDHFAPRVKGSGKISKGMLRVV